MFGRVGRRYKKSLSSLILNMQCDAYEKKNIYLGKFISTCVSFCFVRKWQLIQERDLVGQRDVDGGYNKTRNVFNRFIIAVTVCENWDRNGQIGQ